ncbi:hypothetical protein VTP01DRAFT_6653 [Rhizomucor pusillus]|uniref:uncharacterized protein n=1 Tax=Rhizomucor pusillus TaxID=4840 RepID=UPI0037428B25
MDPVNNGDANVSEGLPDLGFVPSMATYASSATQQQQQQPPGAESSSAADAAGGGGNANSSSASSSSKPQSARPQGRRSRKAPHELLTEAEKKANHIASEQKRRQNIRLGFDQLIEIVPSLSQGNRSEALILQKSVEYIRHLITVKNDLKNQVRDLQSVLGEPGFEEDSSEDEITYSYPK